MKFTIHKQVVKRQFMSSKPVVIHKTRTQFVVDVLRERILSGQIKAGEALRQSALAAELDVSRIPVREGLLQLEAEGLVKFEAHKGATATELSSNDVMELFELRAMIEGDLLARAMPHLSEHDFTQAQQILDQMAHAYENTGDWTTWNDLNSQFHACLYQPANRQYTIDLVKSLNNHADRYIRMHLLLANGIPRSEVEHAELLALAKAGDIDRAVTALRQHIIHAAEDISALLSRSK